MLAAYSVDHLYCNSLYTTRTLNRHGNREKVGTSSNTVQANIHLSGGERQRKNIKGHAAVIAVRCEVLLGMYVPTRYHLRYN